MSDVNLQVVREFFELRLFRVLTLWPHEPRQPGDHPTLLFVENSRPIAEESPGFVLRADDVDALERAVVEVRAWHADRFTPSIVEANPVLYQFARPETAGLYQEIFDGRPYVKILVISELPASPSHAARTAELLQKAGVDHVLEFSTALQGVAGRISVNADYTGSQTLQTLRLLKRYRLLRGDQLEFKYPADAPLPARAPRIETAAGQDEDEDEV